MGTILPLIIFWVLASTHITQLHGSPMRGQRVYGREFLRIPDSESNAGSGKDTVSNRQSRTRQDNSRIDPDIGDISSSFIFSQRTTKTSTRQEQRNSSVIRSSSFSRSLRLPWHKDSPLPVSSHTSREAVRRRLHVNNQTFDNDKIYSKQSHSPDSDSLRQISQNNSDSSSGTFSLQNNNYYHSKLSFNNTSVKSLPTSIFQKNIPHSHSLARGEAGSPMRIGSIPFQNTSEIIYSSAENSSHSSLPTRHSSRSQTTYSFLKDIPYHKSHIDSTTPRTPTQNNQTPYTTIRKLFRGTTTFSPLTRELVSKTEPTSSTDFFLYPVSEYDYYYYSLDDETQLLSSTDEIAVTDPYIRQETVTEVITEDHFSNYTKKNGSEYKINSNENIKIPVSFTTSTTVKSIPLYNKTIILIPRRKYNNISPTSATVQIPPTTTTPVINVVKTRRPTYSYKYTTPSLALRQRLLANRFKIRQFPPQRRGRYNKSNFQNSTNSEIVIKNLEKNISKDKQNISNSEESISYNDTNTQIDPSNINIKHSLSIHNDTNILKLFELSTPESQIDYSIDQQQTSLPSLQIENPSEVNTPLETNIPHPSPLHLLTAPLVVEVNRGPIMSNQGYIRSTYGTLEMLEQINGIQNDSSLVTNGTFVTLTPNTEKAITVLPSSNIINITKRIPYNINYTQQNVGTTIPNTEISTEELDSDMHFQITDNYFFSNLTSSSTIPSTIIPITTQYSRKLKTKEETKASWEAQSRSLSTSAVRTEVRTTEHEVHVKIYEKLPTPPNSEINKMLESLDKLKKQQGTAPFGSSPFGTNPDGTSAFGLVPQGQYPQGRNPLGLATLQQTPKPIDSTSFSPTLTTSTTSIPNIEESGLQTGSVISEPNQSKFQLERKTKDGFIIGEYGVVDHDNGNVNGVRYTAEGNVDPKLIYDALQKFLSL